MSMDQACGLAEAMFMKCAGVRGIDGYSSSIPLLLYGTGGG